MPRGAFIVIEGCDRSGKSTQCDLLIDNLMQNGIEAKKMVFPDRTTSIGRVINSYLKSNINLPDQSIHLLFSANRWEMMDQMKTDLNNGVTLIVDRYSYSGVAYSASKTTHSMNDDWFKAPESGLLRPDIALFLNLPQEVINQRKGFGDEKYETDEIQKRVSSYFDNFKQLNEWKEINANKTIEELSDELFNLTKDIINNVKNKPLSTLW